MNDKTKKDKFPLPRIDDTLDFLSGSRWFSTLDLKSGYWQVEIAPEDREKTAFILPNGLYQFETMPFGLCNAPATFQRLMQTVLRGLFPSKCLIYLDDIIVFGQTAEEHDRNLTEVLRRIQDAGLTLNPKKCCFLRNSVDYLGHQISAEGIKALPDKLETVQNWPLPRSQKELQSFLGLANYYRRFVQGYSQIAAPLHRLTEKAAKRNFNWGPEQDEAFEQLKQKLCEAPILTLPDFSESAPPFTLDTDASDDAVGAVLSQVGTDDKERVIAYASSRLNKQMRRKSATVRELYAIYTLYDTFATICSTDPL